MTLPFEKKPVFDQREDLQICPDCDSDLVYPLEETIEEVGDTHWYMQCRCPNCEWRGVGIHEDSKAEAHGKVMASGQARMAEDLNRLAINNAFGEVDFLLKLVEVGLRPEDVKSA
jgi:hypothetical protein